MDVNIYVIDKKGKKELYDPLIEHYLTSAKKWANVRVHALYPKAVAKAHEISPEAARRSYSETFEPYLAGGFSIALDPQAKQPDSETFADLFKDRGVVNLFIGGAYGFERGFIDKCNTAVSLGKITLSHKLVTVVVAEQIFRALSIVHNHPYHK
jgi:23S rRNA (pseudouridine1915-N3)-methyltransferase